MAKTHYTPEQQAQLLANPHVVTCSSTSITYHPDFKLKAVKAYYEEGNSPNMIFAAAGFDLAMLAPELPKACLKRWRKLYHTDKNALHKERRGIYKGKSIHNRSDLEARIAYLEAENDFLRQLRALESSHGQKNGTHSSTQH